MSDEKKETRIITPIFRVSFPHVFTPQDPMENAPPGTKPKYGVMAVFSPKEMPPDEMKLWQAMAALASEASMKKFGKLLKELPPNYKRPFHRGDEKAEYGFTADQIYTNITSHVKPRIVDMSRNRIIDDPNKFYPGCYARASVGAFGYKKGGGLGVAFGLNSLMFIKDGPRLDNFVEPEKEFEDFFGADDTSAAGEMTDADLGF